VVSDIEGDYFSIHPLF